MVQRGDELVEQNVASWERDYDDGNALDRLNMR